MTDYKVFDPYFSSSLPKDESFFSIKEYSNLLYHKVQMSSYFDDFPKIHYIYDLLLIVKVIDQLHFFSNAETRYVQKILKKLIFQCAEMPIQNVIDQLRELIESTKSNTRSELIIILFYKIAPKSISYKSLDHFCGTIQPMLDILPNLPEFEIANLRKRLDRISSIFQSHSQKADHELSSLIKKYHSA